MDHPVRTDEGPGADRQPGHAGGGAKRIMIIDGDRQVCDLLQSRLTDAGFSVSVLAQGEDAEAAIGREDPHLVMLDLDLPGVITMALMRHVTQRASRDRKPRLMALSAYAGERRVVDGLEQGLDDYVVKPFSVPEVMARVRALLRSIHAPADDRLALEFNGLRLDLMDQRATLAGQRIHVRAAEFRLLEFLMRHPERAYSREQLLGQVWGRDCEVDARAVDVTVQRIRRSLEPHGWSGYVQTVRGVGYRLSANRG
jgi:two-component system, OmpR family, phosphate regulon response regulator PhoB